MDIKLADNINCTGCGACINICSQNAIALCSDEEGFLQPKIDRNKCVCCGRCESICPVMHPVYKNQKIDSCYAAWADEELRRKSSTAGVFALLAKETLQNGGIVYGAAWGRKWKVYHTGITNIDDIKLLQGSKYLQSNTVYTYRETKEALKSGKWVLYSGCPCQIAGLYAYLGDFSIENLTTVEVICHGVPSADNFHKYLNDMFPNKVEDITDIRFRDKEHFGWSSSVSIDFNGKNEYFKNDKEDPYMKGFLPCMTLRRSCENCKFSKIPRQADISLGDFWGIAKYDPSWDDRKGTELILLNNVHGKRIFHEILKEKLTRYQKFPLDAASDVNKTIVHPFHAHPGRKHFFMSKNLKKYDELVNKSLSHNYDFGVIGLWYGINYGSILTYYALYCMLKDLGYDPVMLPKPNSLWSEKFNNPDSIAQKFILKRCNVFNVCRSQGEFARMNDRCRDFIVGSDVVWNYDICGRQSKQFFFLDWVEKGHKKIAYASSFGEKLFGSQEYIEKAQYYLKQFDAISVREEAGAVALKEENIYPEAVRVLDPVFVCDRNIYSKIIEESRVNETNPTIFAYILRKDMAEEKKALLCRISDFFKAEIRICGNPNEMKMAVETYGSDVMPLLSVEDWLYHIKHCSFYVGDSYHALCFSLLFHKPFIIVYGKAEYGFAAERFHSLLKLVGLEERFFERIDEPEKVERLLNKEIDWQHVDEILEKMKLFSLDWLKEVIGQEIKRDSVEFKIINQGMREKSELQVKVYEQEEYIKNLNKELECLSSNSISKMEYIKGKIYGGIRCGKEHGIRYTYRLLINKLNKKNYK